MADGTEGHSTASGPAHALERMIFFSDAVFAIAITLLVIEIHVPEVHRPWTDGGFLRALLPMIPDFVGFFSSFFVIGAFWMGHHRAFDCARHWDPRLMMPNLMMLSAIAAMPFFTAFASEYWGARVPTALYCAWMLLTALLNIRIQRLATAPPVVGKDVTDAQRLMIRQRGQAVALGAATALVISMFAPILAQPSLMSIALWRRLIQRFGDRG
jgi:uncharacterized membrane protein